MHCTLLRSKSHIPEGAERETSFLSKKSVERQSFDNSKGSEVSTVGLRDSNRRCAILTFFSVEPYGQWNIVAVPLEHGSHRNHLCSATGVTSANGHQSHNHGSNKLFVSKEEKSRKRSSRKKMKKKGKQTKKLSGASGLSDIERSVGGLTSETGKHDFIHDRVAPLPCASKLADSVSDDVRNGIYSEGSSSRGYDCMPGIEEVGVSEAFIPYVQPISSYEKQLSGLEDGIQTSEVHDTKGELISYSNVCSGTNDCLVLDSPSPGSNFDNSLSCDNDNAQHSKESTKIDHPKSPGCAAGDGCYSPGTGSLLNVIVATDDHGQKTNYNEKACRSEIIDKRVKKIKRVSQNSTGYRGSSVGNMHGHLGRENNHSVWQKVQKNDTCERNYNSKNVDLGFSQFENKLKEVSSPKNQINSYSSNLKSESEVKKLASSKFCGKMKRKSSQGIKQEFNYHYMKGSQAVGACANQCTRVDMRLTESCSIPAEMNGENRPEAVSISHSNTTFARSRLQTNTVKSIALKPLQSSEACLNDEELLGNVYTTTSRLDDQNENNETSSTLKSYNSMDTSKMLGKLSDVQLDTLDHEGSKTDKNVSHAADHMNGTRSGAIWRNLIPVVVETADSLDLSLYSGLSVEKLDEEAGGDATPRTGTVDKSASDSPSSVCGMNASGTCIRPSSSGVISLPSNNVAQLKNLGNENSPIAKELAYSFGSAQCLITESEKQSMSTSNSDSRKILYVVNDSQRVRLASEAIQLTTGCPIAEFEKLLHSASPVICPSRNIISCQTLFCSSVGRASLCQHEMPNISLAELWQWYEKQGSYGLEVRAEDHEKSNRLGMDSVSFRAYFVPYLSAVQLFSKRKACEDNRNEVPASSAMEASSNTLKATKASKVDRLLNFSLLVPQSKAEDVMSNSGPSAESNTDSQYISSAEGGWSDNLELLFEYFESEQPQRRRPLFEMIKELVRGDVSPQGRAYGDATILNSVCLNDLHPRSWYSVAWYPVYRIPEANFRAAFLTYHSLGHLVHRTLSFDSTGMDTGVVSPVVGLQSYNAQGECWFQPRHSARVLNANPSEILKDRLGTLEEAAAVMARAVVTKGNETSMNMQPDYEFFISRRRY